MKDDIRAVTITLEAGSETCLYISLADDGALTRQGYPRIEAARKDLVLAQAPPEVFESFRRAISEEIEQMAGEYDLPDGEGRPMRLSIDLRRMRGEEKIVFNYGSEGFGPPQAIVDLVLLACRLTEPWYVMPKV